MDLEFVRRLSETNSAATIHLVGPQDDPDSQLLNLPRVEVRSGVALEALPALAADADVLIMPYIDAPVTRAMQPLKLKEYLATGKPVVVRDLPANREWADALDLAATPEQFAMAVKERLRTGIPEQQIRARRRLNRESWAEKAGVFAQLVNQSPSAAYKRLEPAS
jgi:glycosyltransferase involved in cell wall biosynthesis